MVAQFTPGPCIAQHTGSSSYISIAGAALAKAEGKQALSAL
jgi:hypothetical protein